MNHTAWITASCAVKSRPPSGHPWFMMLDVCQESLVGFIFKNDQVNQYWDDADGDDSEDDHQAVRDVVQEKLLFGAVVEVIAVHVQEDVVSIRVWVMTASHRGTQLQA